MAGAQSLLHVACPSRAHAINNSMCLNTEEGHTILHLVPMSESDRQDALGLGLNLLCLIYLGSLWGVLTGPLRNQVRPRPLCWLQCWSL